MELIELLKFSVWWIFLCQATILRLVTVLLKALTLALTVLLFLIYIFYSSICSTMSFPPLGSFDHQFFSVPIEFLSNSIGDDSFHHIAYGYSRIWQFLWQKCDIFWDCNGWTLNWFSSNSSNRLCKKICNFSVTLSSFDWEIW